MEAKTVDIELFRNIEKASLTFESGMNILYGENAQGKTNALEALYLFANGKSFRTAFDKDLVAFGQESSRLSLSYHDGRRDSVLSLRLFAGRGREHRKNGVHIPSAADFMGCFRAVLFSPEHIGVVKGGPGERRLFADAAICQLKPLYLLSLQKYNTILKQRNSLLKSAEKGKPPSFDTMLSLWSAQLAREAAYIAGEREAFTEAVSSKVMGFFRHLSGGEENVTLRYDKRLSEEEYLRKLSENTEREIAAGATLYGIHRDDIVIELNGKDSRLFASQGQQRSIAFALKIGEGMLSEEISGTSPVYLFDDVLSELDARRRSRVLEAMDGRQTVVTTCMERDFDGIAAKKIRVENGRFFE